MDNMAVLIAGLAGWGLAVWLATWSGWGISVLYGHPDAGGAGDASWFYPALAIASAALR